MVLNRIFKPLLGLAVTAATLAVAAPAQAAPQWLTPQTLSQPGQDAGQQQVAFDQGGDAVAVWQSTGGPQPVIMAAARPVGGTFSTAQTLSDPSSYSMSPEISSDAQGDSIAVWLHFDGATCASRLPTGRREAPSGRRRRCRPLAMKQENRIWR